jgi:heat shock protein HtpX
MPETFLDIERSKNRVIRGLLAFLVCFYFSSVYILWLIVINSHNYNHPGVFLWPDIPALLVLLCVSAGIALVHWQFSTTDLLARMTRSLGAREIDAQDEYHHMLSNIVAEVSAAMGNTRPLGVRVIPEASLNAFALDDLQGNAVVGVTEGLLARLNRSQITAVVGHEVAHVISGDCFTTTVVSSLAELYRETLEKIGEALRRGRSRSPALVLVFLVLQLDNLLCHLLAMFISRQKEYRADAVAVRLTRDPLSLAQALSLVSGSWSGRGADGSRLESVFIVSPQASALDEAEGFFADLFSTHPPIRKRIGVLLDMAHMGEAELEKSLEAAVRSAPFSMPVNRAVSAASSWQLFSNGSWRGPFTLEQLRGAPDLHMDSWIRPEGGEVMLAHEQPLLRPNAGKDKGSGANSCPACAKSLQGISYEGARIWECAQCTGVFVPEGAVGKIMIRRDAPLDEGVKRFAKQLCKGYNKYDVFKSRMLHPQWKVSCPQCGEKMRREFFVQSYPVEVDRCYSCNGVWFDKMELEALQYIYEHKEECLYGEKSDAE